MWTPIRHDELHRSDNENNGAFREEGLNGRATMWFACPYRDQQRGVGSSAVYV